jgi:hypothetical protein
VTIVFSVPKSPYLSSENIAIRKISQVDIGTSFEPVPLPTHLSGIKVNKEVGYEIKEVTLLIYLNLEDEPHTLHFLPEYLVSSNVTLVRVI